MLGLWEYFWTEADWTDTSTIVAESGAFSITGQDVALIDSTPSISTSAGGGNYRSIDDEYWTAREQYLRRMLQALEGDSNAAALQQLEPLDALSSQRSGSELPIPDVRSTPYSSVTLDRALELEAYAAQLARLASTRAQLTRANALVAATSRTITRLKQQHEIENFATVMALLF